MEDLHPAAGWLEAQAHWRRNPTALSIPTILPTLEDMDDAIIRSPINQLPDQTASHHEEC